MEWISVNDRLPEFWIPVLLYNIKVKSVIAMGELVISGSFIIYENRETTNQVTHWMPLPEPPKQDKA